MKKYIAIISSAFISITAFAQPCYQPEPKQLKSIETDVVFLSSDLLEGRSPGTHGEKMARDYISKRMMQMGVVPQGLDGSYNQPFEVAEPVLVDTSKTTMTIKGEKLVLNKQFFPLVYSANGAVKAKTQYVHFGITAPEKEYDDYAKISTLEGKIAVMDVSSPDGIHPHSAYAKYHDLGGRVALAKEKGAVGVVFVNLGEMANDADDSYKSIRSENIPVVFVKDDAMGKKLKKSKVVEIAVQQEERAVTAYNVVGFLDNGKPTTVVIGAHYDHLGYGNEGSLYVGEPAIHNGADDNASGTAALLALAEFMSKRTELTGHNYLFIAFTAEEKGLLGSNYFVNHPTYPLEKVAYMINMDMVGRLRDQQLQISGTGTATEWEEMETTLACTDLQIKIDPSGTGPSDHTSFYNMNIPVLHFFTGSHSDYHKPSDDAELINYKGIGEVVGAIKTVMAKVDSEETLRFQKTQNADSRKAPKFSVTLGIMPDYMYEKGGVKVDGVTPEKPAALAGIQKGDIILQLGDFTIEDIYAYMNALSAFKKGDKVKVTYIHEGETVNGKIQF